MDRISRLSNETICHIVSFLSAKEAAFAKVLSKRWQNLYTIIPNLEFDNTVGSLKDYLNGLLALPASSRIRRCSIKCRALSPSNHCGIFNRFLCNVLKRGVMNLKLAIWVTLDGSYSLPSEIFTSKTLVELELGSILEINLLPENALLPALKSLVIVSVRFSDHHGCAFQKLLSACPVLVDLTLSNVEWEFWKWSRTVSSPTLERLTINHRYVHSFGIIEYDLESITFDTPSLKHLKYFDFAPKSYPIVNLDSLVEATIFLTLPQFQTWSGQYVGGAHGKIKSDITNLIKGLRNVEILNLMTMETFYYFHKAIPVFEKLHHLTVATQQNSGWRTLPYLLKKSPNLKTLVAADPLRYNRLSNNVSFSYPVKVLEITEYHGTKGELSQLKHFLEKLSNLELVKVSAYETKEKKQIQLRNNLLDLPRSSKCKIELEFSPPR